MDSRPRRRLLVTLLVFAGTLVGLLAINAVWLNRQVLNEDNWAESSSELLESDAVRGQISNFLVDEAYTNSDVPERVSAALPPRAQPLAGPIAGALRTGAERATDRLLQRPRVQELWEESNRRAHERLLTVLDGGGDNVSTSGGDVTLDLEAMLLTLTDQLGVGEKAAAALPPDAAQITVLHSDELELAQDGLDAVRGLTLVLLVLSLGLFALAVLLAGRRQAALRAVGFGFIFIGLVALVERKVAGDALVNALVDTESTKAAVEDVWTIATSLLVEAAVSTIAYGVLFVAAAWLAGRTHSATVARTYLAPYLRSPAWAYGTLAGIVLLVAAWGPTPATRKPISMLLLAALMALGIEMLRRQTAREHPDATLERVAEERRERREADRRLERLEVLGRLHDTGVIDDGEFDREKTLALAHTGSATGEV